MQQPLLDVPYRKLIEPVLRTAVVVGALQLVFYGYLQMEYRDVPPLRILQNIAGAIMGREAFRGGDVTALLGLGLHFFIATLWTSLFTYIYQQVEEIQRLTERASGLLIVGLGFGALVWIFMDLGVLPLTYVRPLPVTHLLFWAMLIGHMVFVGLPIAFRMDRAIRDEAAQQPVGPRVVDTFSTL